MMTKPTKISKVTNTAINTAPNTSSHTTANSNLNTAILTQNAPEKLANKRFKSPYLWLTAILPLTGAMVAVATSPKNSLDALPNAVPVTVEVRLPEQTLLDLSARAEHAENDLYYQRLIVPTGQTLSQIFAAVGVVDSKAEAFLRANPHDLGIFTKAGGQLEVVRTGSGALQSLNTAQLDDKGRSKGRLVLRRDEMGIFRIDSEASVLAANTLTKTIRLTQSGADGFADAAKMAGVPDDIASTLPIIFAPKLAFAKLLADDEITVVYETKEQPDGTVAEIGKVMAAEIDSKALKMRVFSFADRDGEVDYYDQDGKALQALFSREPVSGARISSGFAGGRLHPVLGVWRAHKGVDFAAPTGTPIHATADAKVKFIGGMQGYGNAVVLSHGSGYETLYGHMSAFANKLSIGQSVTQGQIIGFVGQTGLASGPHLHYEFRVNDVQVDPQTVQLPTGRGLANHERSRFASSVGEMKSYFKTHETMTMALNKATFE